MFVFGPIRAFETGRDIDNVRSGPGPAIPPARERYADTGPVQCRDAGEAGKAL